MRKQRFSPSTEHKRLRYILLGIAIVILLTFGYMIYLYNTVLEQKTETFQNAKQQAIAETPLKKVDSITRYHGANHVDVVIGEDVQGKPGYAFIPVNKDGDQVFRYADEGVSRKAIKEQWRSLCSNCQFIDLTLAIDKQSPLWEFTYIDTSGRYVFDYYRLKDGSKYEQFRLKQSDS